MTGTGEIPAFVGMTWVGREWRGRECGMTGTGGDSRLRGNDVGGEEPAVIRCVHYRWCDVIGFLLRGCDGLKSECSERRIKAIRQIFGLQIIGQSTERRRICA